MNSFFDRFFKNKYLPYFVLLLVPFLLYKKALAYGFSPLDEQWLIEDNNWFLEKWSNLKTAFTHSTALQIYYRPFFVVSLMFDYHLGALKPTYYHLDTLLWHLCCTVLLFKFLQQFNISKVIAFFMALLFAVHPIMLHAVAWVPGRNDSMLCFFMLLSYLQLIKYIDQKKIKYFLFHHFFFCCALLNKETALVLPLLYGLLLLYRVKGSKKILYSSCAVWAVILLGWVFVWKTFVTGNGITESTVAATGLNTIQAYLLYLGKIIFPFQQSVSPVLSNTSILPGVLTLVVLIVLVWSNKSADKKIIVFGTLQFFILLFLPILFIAFKTEGQYYEHRLYSSMVGVFLVLSQVKLKLKTTYSIPALSGIVIIFALISSKRMEVYKDKFSFIDAAVISDPDNFFIYLRKGQLLSSQGDYEKSIIALSEAIKRSPTYGQSYLERGNANLALAKKEPAIADYNAALKYSKTNMKNKVLLQRCLAYDLLKEPELALKDLETLKASNSKLVAAEFERNLRKKIHAAQVIPTKDLPQTPEECISKGVQCMEERKPEEALALFKRAMELAPTNSKYKQLYERACVDLAPFINQGR